MSAQSRIGLIARREWRARVRERAFRVATGINLALVLVAAFLPTIIAYFADDTTLRAIRIALSARDGAIIPLLTAPEDSARLLVERHVCIDTTAAGGNATLMAQAG